MRRLASILLCLLALTAPAAGAPAPKRVPTLLAYQAASQYWSPKGGGPRIRVVATDVREVSFTVHILRALPLRDGLVDADHVPVSALGPQVHQHTEVAHGGKAWKNPQSGLTHRGATIEGEYRLPLKEDGVYLLTVRAGATSLHYLYVVSPLGVVVNHTRQVVAGYLYDQKQRRPVAGAVIDVWNGAGEHQRVRTSGQGTFQVRLPRALTERLTVVAASGSATAVYTEGVYGRPYTRESVYLFTDRPLYRGGHTVYYKGTLERAGAVAAGEPVRVEVRDPANHVLQERASSSSRYGSFHGSVDLPADTPPGEYNLIAQWGERRFYQTFTVRQYRKPWFEVKVKPAVADVRQGTAFTATITAASFTGMPVSKGQVSVTVRATPRAAPGPPATDDTWEVRSSPLLGAPRTVLEQALELDERGVATVKVDTATGDTDFDYTVVAEVRDAEHHAASGSGSVLVTRAAVLAGAWVERDLLAAGDEAAVFLRTTTVGGSPCALPLSLHLERASFSAARRTPTWSATEVRGEVATGADGRGQWTFKVPSGGYYRVVVTGRDDVARPTRAETFFWASGSGAQGGQASLELVSDRRAYRVGDTAHLLVNSGLKDAWVYLSVEGTSVHDQRVFRLDGTTGTCEIPVTEALSPGFYVHASIVHGGQYVGGSLALAVPDRSKILKVSVEPAQTVCRPGEETAWRVRITDAEGRPVETEFAMAVVDEALLALQADATPDPRAFFYGRRQNEVVTGYSVPREVTGGAYQNVPQKPRPQADLTRSSFRDTAYWNPVLTTAADGTAIVRLKLPDNLTRWKGTVRAVTPTVQVGMGADSLLARKDLMIRLATPRFMRADDTVEVAAEVQNLTDRPQDVVATLAVDGAAVRDAGPRVLKMAPRASGQVRWTLAAQPPLARARFQVQARAADSGLADAERLDVPLLPWGREGVAFRPWRQVAGSTSEDRFDLPAGSTRRVTLRFAPSVAAAALGGMEALASFPYGCTEQTMSSFLPDVALASVLKRTGLRNGGLEARLPGMVRAGLTRLYGYQHEDGGWGWWRDDRSDPFMTAYVVYGLALCHEAGHPVASDVLDRGREWLRQNPAATPDGRAFAARAVVAADVALAGREMVQPASTGSEPRESADLGPLLKEAPALGPFGQAMLVEALARQGRAAEARRVLDLAWARGTAEGESLFHWTAGGADDRWGNTDVEVTAALLSSAARVTPDDPRVQRAAAWLMQRRGGDMWGTTRATSLALLALSEVMAATHETRPDHEARVTVNGREVQRFRFGPDAALEVERRLDLPAAALVDGANVVRVEVSGQGVLYGSREVRTFVAGEPAAARNGIEVRRRWQVRGAQGAWVDADRPLRAGEDVQVVLDVVTAEPRAHVLVEDRLAAGFEVAESDAAQGWNRRDVLDDRVAFFFTQLPAGTTTLTYWGRPETAGRLHVMPARAEMMYLPSVSGQSDGRVLEVRP